MRIFMPWTMVGQWWQNLCSIDFSTSVLLGSPDATEIRRSLTDLSCRLRSSMVIAARASYSRQVWSIPFFCLSMNCGVRRTPSNPYNHLSIFSTVGKISMHAIIKLSPMDAHRRRMVSSRSREMGSTRCSSIPIRSWKTSLAVT